MYKRRFPKEDFETSQQIEAEIIKQFEGDEVKVRGLSKSWPSLGHRTSSPFAINEQVYQGVYWWAHLEVIVQRDFEEFCFEGNIYMCTPHQYEEMCIEIGKTEWMDHYPLDTITFIKSEFCERVPWLDEGEDVSIRELPRTIKQYVYGWHLTQSYDIPSFVLSKVFRIRDKKRVLERILGA